MRAVTYPDYRQQPRVEEVPVPPCPPDGALVAVAATGVCRSDWHAWQGGERVPLPHVPGHELAGTVVEVGPEVRDVEVGTRVTTPFVSGCGECETCREGDAQVCRRQTQPGFSHWGSFAEVVAVRHADVNIVTLPDDLDFVTAAGLGCRFATAYRAVRVHADAGDGRWLAVHGCGGVGLSAVMVAHAVGGRVVAVDPSEPARDAARALGAEVVIDPAGSSSREVAKQVVAATGGGVHASLDALGSRPTCEASVRSLRPRGRHVQVGLLIGADARPDVALARILSLELSFHGSHGMPAAAYPDMLAEIAAGTLDPAALVGRVIGLDEAPAALVGLGEAPVTSGMTVVDLARA
jgi:alcohol dehydrogenase